MVMNKNKININIDFVREKFEKSLATYDSHAKIQREMAKKLVELILEFNGFNQNLKIVEFGCGTGLLTKEIIISLSKRGDNIISFFITDIVDSTNILSSKFNYNFLKFQQSNMENFVNHKNIKANIVVSNAVFQWLSSPEFFYSKISNNFLEKNSILAFTHFGRDNLKEIRQIEKVGLNYFDEFFYKDLASKNKLKLLYFAEETHTIYFDSVKDILKHMRYTGVTGVEKKVWSKKHYENFCYKYKQLFYNKDLNKYPLTYHPQYIVMKKD